MVRDTLCWKCKNATTAGCSWSDKFIPVEGWDATPTYLKRGYTLKGEKKEFESSYIVHSCPLFERG